MLENLKVWIENYSSIIEKTTHGEELSSTEYEWYLFNDVELANAIIADLGQHKAEQCALAILPAKRKKGFL